MTITQQEVNDTAWRACDTFRGVLDPAQYKDYILVMLFLKYVSDLWKDHYEEYKAQYGDDDERIRRRLERERFILPYVELKEDKTGKLIERFLGDFYSLYQRRNEANIGELINVVLDHVEVCMRSASCSTSCSQAVNRTPPKAQRDEI